MLNKKLVVPEVRKHVMQQSADGGKLPTAWWFTTVTPERTVLTESSDGNHVHPLVEQQVFAADLAQELNRELSHRGTWVVAFSHPGQMSDAAGALVTRYYARWYMLWFDEDGDLHFVIDNVEPFGICLGSGVDFFMESAEKGYEQWLVEFNKLEVKQDQMRRAALGEKSKGALNGNS